MNKLIMTITTLMFSASLSANILCNGKDLISAESMCNFTSAVQGFDGDLCYKGDILKAKEKLETEINKSYEDDELFYNGIWANIGAKKIIVKFLSYGEYPHHYSFGPCL